MPQPPQPEPSHDSHKSPSQDLLEQLRPKLVRFATFEEACRAVDQVEMEEARNAAAGLPDVQQSESDDEPLEYASDRDREPLPTLPQCTRSPVFPRLLPRWP